MNLENIKAISVGNTSVAKILSDEVKYAYLEINFYITREPTRKNFIDLCNQCNLKITVK